VEDQGQPDDSVPMFLSAMLAAFSILIFPAAFEQPHTLAAAADIHEFADWANVIPPTSTVLVAPPHDVGAFVWFTLARPNYLALESIRRVVFSRTTALEVRRRSEYCSADGSRLEDIDPSACQVQRGRKNEAHYTSANI